ncbi:MAG: Cna B-type domain-containing protein [Anaerotignum sp.]|nr:Cna B-type domain-containing protein [Anaerotignum sp.]
MKYENGKEVVYAVTENAVEHYSTDIAAGTTTEGGKTIPVFTITNRHKHDTTSVMVTKHWDDKDNKDDIRPATITVVLKDQDKNVIGTKMLSASNGWSAIWNDLPLYQAGETGVKVEYSVEETTVPTEYTESYVTLGENNFEIINKHEPKEADTVTIHVQKAWYEVDGSTVKTENLPKVVRIALYGDGMKQDEVVLTADTGWEHTFYQKAKLNAAGIAVKYTVVEEEIAGYRSEVTVDTTNADKPEITVKNIEETVVPGKVDFSFTKVWDDKNNADKLRPSVTDYASKVTLYKGSDVVAGVTPRVIDNGDNTYTVTWKNLTELSGTEVYSAKEATIDGYTANLTEVYDGERLINTHEVTEPDTVNVTVTKKWEDNNNQDGIRPEFVLLQLMADGVPQGEPVVVSAAKGWRHTWSKLPKEENGSTIVYTVEEARVEGYEAPVITGDAADGFIITNRHEPETTEIAVTKIWDDVGNKDGKRPTSVTVNLLKNGKKADSIDLDNSNADSAGNWIGEFKNLPVYERGQKIDYTISEDKVEGYTAKIDHTLFADGTIEATITNSYTPNTTAVTVKKIWNDNNNQDGKRPDSVTVTLKNGDAEIATGEITADDGWKYVFEGLDKYDAGKEIEYTVVEDVPTGYAADYEAADETAAKVKNGVATIINSCDIELMDIKVIKIWDDDGNAFGERPEQTTITLYKNGVPFKTKVFDADADTTEYTFEGVPKYENGVEIVYSVSENALENYSTTVEGEAPAFTVTDTYKPGTTSVSVMKIWDDKSDADSIRPAYITVELKDTDGVSYGEMKLSAERLWSHTWNNLPIYKGSKKIVYEIVETGVPTGYTSTTTPMESGFILINSYTPQAAETVTITVTKEWYEADGVTPITEDSRLQRVKAILYADGSEVDSKWLMKGNGWKVAFNAPTKTASGDPISYVVEEDSIEGYQSEVSGSGNSFTIKNIVSGSGPISGQYVVHFEANGGTGNMADMFMKYNETKNLTENAFTRAGYTFTGWKADADGKIYTDKQAITYNFGTDVHKVTMTAQWKSDSSGGGGGGGGGSKTYTLSYESNGGTKYGNEKYSPNTLAKLDKTPTRNGYEFTGWYTDKALTNKVDGVIMDENRTVYAGWKKLDGEVDEDGNADGEKEIAPVPDALNGKDHLNYMVGYPDGTIHPERNITRAEVAMMFFRLLDDEVRAANYTKVNTFTDVPSDQWYNTAISTMAKLGVLKGYEDGSFLPNGAITRAEFAAIAARFDRRINNETTSFRDVLGHWAELEIAKAAKNSWVAGYPDGTFMPDAKITRAEAMAMVNRVLKRNPEKPEDLLDTMLRWTDNMDTTQWYYLHVQEATNHHEYTRETEHAHERWTVILPSVDWAVLETRATLYETLQ